MATISVFSPDATSPTTVQLNQQNSGKFKVPQSMSTIARERERNGTYQYPAARYQHYLPVWDNEKGNRYGF